MNIGETYGSVLLSATMMMIVISMLMFITTVVMVNGPLQDHMLLVGQMMLHFMSRMVGMISIFHFR